MCGIVGFTGSSHHPTAVLERMLERVRTRGPDDHGVWSDGAVHLGHARLSILDPTPRGHQPMLTPDGAGVLSFNGEVYNFPELRRDLERSGVEFGTGTDTEAVLHALHCWGPETAVARFDGMFALAYHDRRDGSVWLARDRMGIKPLFTAASPGGTVFASEQKALFEHPDVRPAIDELALSELLLYERLEGATTLHRGIELFPPGTVACVAGSAPRRITYFDVLRDLSVDRIRAQADTPFPTQVDRLRARLETSIELHLRSDVPVAALCSGGLDSGLVTTVAARRQPDLVAYVADIEGMQGAERRRAEAVTTAAGIELRPVPVGREDFLRTLPHSVVANDQPLFFSQQVAAMLVASAVHRDGFKVVLTGDGADELFGGYSWHAQAHRRWRRARLRARLIPDNAISRRVARLVPALAPVDLERMRSHHLLLHHAINHNSATSNLQFLAGMPRVIRERHLFERLDGLPLPERAFLAKSFQDIDVHMREALNTLDKMTMRHSVEARVPFLENDVIELAMDLPVDAKLHRGTGKRVVRELARQELPAEVVELPKIGFRMPAAVWRPVTRILTDGHLAELLRWAPADRAEIMDLAASRPYFHFRLLATEIWLRTRFHGEDPDDIGNRLLGEAHVEVRS